LRPSHTSARKQKNRCVIYRARMYKVKKIVDENTPLDGLSVHIIWACIGAVCRKCGIVGNACTCWQDAEYSEYKWFSELYMLNIDCNHCTRSDYYSQCTCWRVYRMTHCVCCNRELYLNNWNRLIDTNNRFVRYCSWACACTFNME
jgi:hypothetical protein